MFTGKGLHIHNLHRARQIVVLTLVLEKFQFHNSPK